jgi:hypothetical protein
MKYLLREWSIMTLFTPLLVTSLYEVFIERMEHNDTLHSEVTLSRGMKDVITLHPLNKYFIQ